MAEGRGGVVKKFLGHTTRLRELLWLRGFLLLAHLPLLLLRRGADCGNLQSAPQFGPFCLAGGAVALLPRLLYIE